MPLLDWTMAIWCFVFAPKDAEEAASCYVAPPVTMKVRKDLRSAENRVCSDGGLSERQPRTRSASRATVLWTWP